MQAPDTKRHQLTTSVIVLGTVLLHDYIRYFYAYIVFGRQEYNNLPDDTRTWYIQITALLFCIAATGAIALITKKSTLSLLGLNKNPSRALLIAVACTSAMFIGFAVIAPLRTEIDFSRIFQAAIWAGFNEELVFRAFITGILIREGGWHFIPAALISALLFAKGHLYQASGFSEAVSIFLFVSGAGIGFSVFYWLWRWNIWFTIFMHILMNLSFILFDVGNTALLNGSANIYRFITIALAIAYTIGLVWKRKSAEKQAS